MSPYIAFLVLLAAAMHASWNAVLRAQGSRFLSGTLMAFSAGLVGLATAAFVPLPEMRSVPFILASALLHLVYNLLLISMYREGDLGHSYPIARGSSPMLIAIGAGVFAGEKLDILTGLGVFMISIGILALSTGGHLSRRGIMAALATGGTIAAYSIIDGLGARLSGNVMSYSAWMFAGYGLPMPIIFLLARSPSPKVLPDPRQAFAIIGGGLMSVLGYGIVIYAMVQGAMGPVSALRETSVLFAVLIGVIFLKEKFTMRKVISASLIVIGAIILQAN